MGPRCRIFYKFLVFPLPNRAGDEELKEQQFRQHRLPAGVIHIMESFKRNMTEDLAIPTEHPALHVAPGCGAGFQATKL